MKLITLTLGKFAQVNDEDYEWLNQHKWIAKKYKSTFYAAKSQSKKWTHTKMHRIILNLTDPKMFGDHIDHNGLNNQRNNLRIATRSENCKNKTSSGKSQYLGVHYHISKRKNINKIGEVKISCSIPKWRVSISVNRKQRHFGLFENEIEAAKKYDELAKIYHKEFANLNFK